MERMKLRAIAYYRVSTKQQGVSGLGIEAQEAAVAAYVATTGMKLLAPPYVEVESGTKGDRPKLAAALAHAKRAKATLLIAKLDRLIRNVAFLANLMDSEIDFVACDNPHANRLTVHILAAVAEEEARAISDRTKKALAAAKARGTRRGFNRPEPGCSPKVFETTTRNVAHQRDLYTIVTEEGVRDFEFDNDLQAVERQVNGARRPGNV